MENNTALITKVDNLLEKVVLEGDLTQLLPVDRVAYYSRVCDSLGLNPYTRPFEYIKLNGKLTLYARRDATDQLRNLKNVSINITNRETIDGVYIVTAQAQLGERTDESTGAVDVSSLKGETKANAMMKAETKAKRRVTLSIVGLGWLDETEVESISKTDAQRVKVDDAGVITTDASKLWDNDMPAAKEDTKECPVHKVLMDVKHGAYGKFYSHKLDDGTWCNGKEKKEWKQPESKKNDKLDKWPDDQPPVEEAPF